MVLRTFIRYVRYIYVRVNTNKDTMLACRWIKLLTYFVMFWAKQQLMMHFIQNLSLNFHSLLELYKHGSGSSVDNNRWYRFWVELGRICSFHFVCLLKAHMNLNGIRRLYGLME